MKNNRKNRKRLKMLHKRAAGRGYILKGAHVLGGDNPMTPETVNALSSMIGIVKKKATGEPFTATITLA